MLTRPNYSTVTNAQALEKLLRGIVHKINQLEPLVARLEVQVRAAEATFRKEELTTGGGAGDPMEQLK